MPNINTKANVLVRDGFICHDLPVSTTISFSRRKKVEA